MRQIRSKPTTSRLPIIQRRIWSARVYSVRYWMMSTPAPAVMFTTTPPRRSAPGSRIVRVCAT
jgi:hypothetical protein